MAGRYNEAVSGNRNDNDGIRTPRLWLREAREGDLDAFHAFLSDADVMRYWYVQTLCTFKSIIIPCMSLNMHLTLP